MNRELFGKEKERMPREILAELGVEPGLATDAKQNKPT